MDTKAFKRSLHKSEQYHRKGFGHEEEVTNLLQSEYNSKLIQQIRNNGYRLQQGDVTIHLAEAFGFCWGLSGPLPWPMKRVVSFPKSAFG